MKSNFKSSGNIWIVKFLEALKAESKVKMANYFVEQRKPCVTFQIHK